MELLPYHLKEFIKAYRPAIEKIRDIEDKAAINAINFKFADNIRHCIEHLVVSIEEAFKVPPEKKNSEYHLGLALHDQTNLVSDACEHIAGRKLKEAEKHILSGISLSERKNAQELYKHAYYHYTQGRNKRTLNPGEANDHFTKTVELCVEAMLSVNPITTRQWVTWLLMFLSILAGLSGWAMFLAKVFNVF